FPLYQGKERDFSSRQPAVYSQQKKENRQQGSVGCWLAPACCLIAALRSCRLRPPLPEDSGDAGSTARALGVAQVVSLQPGAPAADDGLLAPGTQGLCGLTDHVAEIDIAQPRLLPRGPCLAQ